MRSGFAGALPAPCAGPTRRLTEADAVERQGDMAARAGRTIRLVTTSPAGDAGWTAQLEAEGYEIDRRPVAGPDELKELERDPPAAVVIDLRRAPASGRDIALALRHRKATRLVPIVLVAGDDDAFGRIKALPADAVQALPQNVDAAVARAIALPPVRPLPPPSPMAGYSGTPLPKKLGIKPGSRVVLVGSPDGFERLLEPLPSGVRLRRTNRGARDVTLWFTRSKRELERGVAAMARAAGDARLWIVWPKKASPLAADHTELDVRRVGLAAGLVDFKICAVDADWSGLAFARRR